MAEQNVRKIVTADVKEPRVEMGALQINDDWPGLFIRGDRCFDLDGRLAQAEMLLEKYVPKELQDIDYKLALAGLEGVRKMIEEDVLVKPKA